jgi:(S)-3,5-dihydroxyphenylglycine transaminase
VEVTTNRALALPHASVMTFLNEVVQAHPTAISFAPGRPAEQFFDIEGALASISHYVDYAARRTGASRTDVLRGLGQYVHTSGVIRELLQRYLATDENIHVAEDAIVVTNGAQEAMVIVLLTLFDPAHDVLLVADPSYIGITGAAALLGIEVHPICHGDNAIDFDALSAAIHQVRATGKRARALYDIPDFHNPRGTVMTLAARHRLLEIAHQEGLVLIEDNPYGILAYDDPPLPTLKALDRERNVVYIGTFSKSLFPGLRLGYVVADQPLASARSRVLAHELSKVKSLTTVNTSPLVQAIVGGILLQHEFSLIELNREKLQLYKRNRDRMLACLARRFGEDEQLAPVVTWNAPRGGLFITVTLPFMVDDVRLRICARDYGVIFCPMMSFSLTNGHEQQIRLSFSYVTDEQIERGIESLWRFVRDTVSNT